MIRMIAIATVATGLLAASHAGADNDCCIHRSTGMCTEEASQQACIGQQGGQVWAPQFDCATAGDGFCTIKGGGQTCSIVDGAPSTGCTGHFAQLPALSGSGLLTIVAMLLWTAVRTLRVRLPELP